MPCPVETAVVAGKQTEPAEVARSEGDGACWRLGVVAAAAEAGPPMAEDGRAMDPGTAKLVAPLADMPETAVWTGTGGTCRPRIRRAFC